MNRRFAFLSPVTPRIGSIIEQSSCFTPDRSVTLHNSAPSLSDGQRETAWHCIGVSVDKDIRAPGISHMIN